MSTKSTNSIFSPGLVLQGRYRLDEPVASGGMAEVWRGHDLVLQRHVAVKLLHPHLASNPELAERFKREAIAAARLSHPHVVPTFDAGSDRNVFYIVMGLISGPTLAEVMTTQQFSQDQVAEIGRQIADALDHAHKHGLVHRDIKPSNVLVVDSGSRVMVADFGIAKAVADSANESTLPGLVVGTSGYMSPEEASGAQVDARADVFALGVLLHEMFCHHADVEEQTAITSVPTTGPFPSSGKCQYLPEPIKDVIEKATAHEPDDRFETAGKMRDELVRVELLRRAERTGIEPRVTAEGGAQPTGAADGSAQPIGAETGATQEPINLANIGDIPSSTSEQPTISPFGGRYNPIPAQKAARKRRLVTGIIAICLVLLAIGTGLAVKSLANGMHHVTTTTNKTGATPAIAGATSFDPFGDDHVENPDQVSNAIDNDPTTTWSTQIYSNSHFGNLKSGVGLILHVNEGTKLNQLELDSPTSNWAASIYVANNSPTSLDGWGTPVAGNSAIASGTTTFQLNGATGNSVLIWITNLGNDNRVAISEARVQ